MTPAPAEGPRGPGAQVPSAPAPDLRNAFDAMFLQALRPATVAVGIIYVAYAVAEGVVVPPPAGTWIAAMDVAMAAVFLGTGVLLRRWTPPSAWAHPIGCLLASLAIAVTLVTMRLTADPVQTLGLMLIVLGVGVLFLSTPAVVYVLVASGAGWMAVASRGSFGGDWVQFGVGFLAACILAFLGHRVRRAAFARVEALRGVEADQRNELTAMAARLSDAQRIGRIGSWQWDIGRDHVVWSDELYRIYGLDPAGFRATYGAYLEQVHPDDRLRVDAAVGKALKDQHAFAFDHRFVRRDGTVGWMHARGTVTAGHDGKPVRMAGIGQDITERKQAEDEARTARERLAEIERLKENDRFRTQLFNTASHELNTPLTPLKIQLHLLRSGDLGPLSADQKRAVEVLGRNTDRLAALVQDVLDVARLETGAMRMDRKELDLRTLMLDAVEPFRVGTDHAHVALAFSGERPVVVDADERRIMQVLMNLLNNALKFTPPSGRVTLSAWRDDERAFVRVADTGVGLSPAAIEKLFRPFSQVHDPTKFTATGTGLGLFICKGIVEAHGGRIHVRSEGPGRGATFTVELPLHVKEEGGTARETGRTEASDAGAAHGAGAAEA